jgi:hypothetical protein
VVHNVTASEATAGPYTVGGSGLDRIFGSGEARNGAEGWTVVLPAGGSGVWKLRP